MVTLSVIRQAVSIRKPDSCIITEQYISSEDIVSAAMRTFTKSNSVSVVESAVEEYTRRTVTVDFLYLDNESCERCAGTENALETALTTVEPVFEALEISLFVRDIHVDTLEAAEATQLPVSPTIRIDGSDLQPDYRQDVCESCSNLCECQDRVECRLWRYRGEEHTVPPVELLVEALVRAAVIEQSPFNPARGETPNGLSANIASFFEKTETSEVDCGCS